MYTHKQFATPAHTLSSMRASWDLRHPYCNSNHSLPPCTVETNLFMSLCGKKRNEFPNSTKNTYVCWIVNKMQSQPLQQSPSPLITPSEITHPPPSYAYMRQWIGSALVQIMACRLYSAPSHYLNQCWIIVNWTLRNKLKRNFNQNTKLFIHENASENIVCEMAAILSRGRRDKRAWVNIPVTGTCIVLSLLANWKNITP